MTPSSLLTGMLLAARKARHEGELDRARLDWIFGLFPALQKFWLYPAGKLSGGQKQRAWIAMVLAQESGTILLDEPTNHLDVSHAMEVLELVRRLKERGVTNIRFVCLVASPEGLEPAQAAAVLDDLLAQPALWTDPAEEA